MGEDEGIGWVVESIEGLLPAAEEAGVILTLENHYKDGTWEYPEFAQSRERFLRIVNSIQSPWLRVQYDPSNAVVSAAPLITPRSYARGSRLIWIAPSTHCLPSSTRSC